MDKSTQRFARCIYQIEKKEEQSKPIANTAPPMVTIQPRPKRVNNAKIPQELGLSYNEFVPAIITIPSLFLEALTCQPLALDPSRRAEQAFKRAKKCMVRIQGSH
eukprot:6566198-Ditylum_brightwellii.AAC.1